MAMFNRRDDFGWMAVSLHWLLFILLLGLIVGGKYSASLESSEKIRELVGIHKQIGVAVFILMAFRLLWRLANTKPEALSDVFIFKFLAFIVHWLLYIVVLFQAAIGVYMSQLGGRAVSFLGLELPSLTGQANAILEFIAFSPALHSFLFAEIESPGKQMRELHYWGGTILIALIVIHVLGVIMHQFILRDDSLRRMFYRYTPPHVQKDPGKS